MIDTSKLFKHRLKEPKINWTVQDSYLPDNVYSLELHPLQKATADLTKAVNGIGVQAEKSARTILYELQSD